MEGYFQSHGGALLAEAAAYIPRSQVEQVLGAIRAGEFCYILTPRQMGKTTLKNVVVADLNKTAGPEKIHPVSVDLDRIGTPGALPPDPNQATANFYYGLLEAIAAGLNLHIDFPRWWQEQSNLSFVQRFSKFMRDVVLDWIPSGSVVIFVDEIGTIRSLGADADGFFAAIRALYNARGDDADFQRLTFVLLGTATPSDLIKDPTRTPFNLGRSIGLGDFTLEEAAPWRAYLEQRNPGHGAGILSAVFEWTNGHPALTQRLCAAIDASGHTMWTGQRVHDWVEGSVLPEMVKEIRSDQTLAPIQRSIVALPDKERKAILQAYQEIHDNFGRRGVRDDRVSSEQETLKMLGLIREQNGFLHVRNRLFFHVFDQAWIRSHMPTHLPTDLAVALSTNPVALGLVSFLIVILCGAAVLLRGGLLRGADQPATAHTPAPTQPPSDTAVQPLSFTKSAVAVVSPGETITTTLMVRNLGGEQITNIKVRDAFDPLAILRPSVISPEDGVGGTNAIVWESVTLGPYEYRAFSWRGVIASDIALGTEQNPTVISHEAVLIRAGQLVTRATFSTQVVPRGINLISQASPSTVSPGETITYVLTVRNSGMSTLRDVKVQDVISPDIVRVIDNITHQPVLTASDIITWVLDELPPGETVEVRWQGQVDLLTASKSIKNRASVIISNEGKRVEQTHGSETAVRQPVLTLSKQAPVNARPGETVVYKILVENVGAYFAADVIVTDTVPAGVLHPGNIQEGGVLYTDTQRIVEGGISYTTTHKVVWRIPQLSAQEQRTLSWQGQVDPAIDPAVTSVISGTTFAQALRGTGIVTATASALTTLGTQPLSLVKTATESVFPGGSIAFSLTVENVGDTSLYDLLVRDTVPNCVESPTIIQPAGTYEGSNLILWSLDSLEQGKTATFEWQGVVCDDTPVGQITSMSQVTVQDIFQEDIESVAPVEPLLSLNHSAKGQAGPGQDLNFNLTVKAVGSVQGTVPAPDVVVEARIPRYIIDVDSFDVSGGGTIDGDTIVWKLGAVSKDETLDLNWIGTIDPAIPQAETEVTSQASVTNGSGQRVEAGVTIHLLSQSISLTSSAPVKVWPGQDITFQLFVANNSSATLYQVEVSNALPTHIINPSNISSNGRLEDTTIVWVLESIEPNDTISLSWQGSVDPAIPTTQTNIQNRATATTASGLTGVTTSSSTLVFSALTLSKAATLQAGPGGTLDYTLTVSNSGSAPALGVVVQDEIPEYLDVNTGAISHGGGVDGNNVTWEIGALQVDQQLQLTWQGTLQLGIPADIDRIPSQATVSSIQGLAAQAEASTAILHPAITLSKTGPATAAPGQVLTYTLEVRNIGELILEDVVVIDTLPTQVFTPTTEACGGTRQADTITWILPDLDLNESHVIDCPLLIDPNLFGVASITNQASVTAWPGVQDHVNASTVISGVQGSAIGYPLVGLKPTMPFRVGQIDRQTVSWAGGQYADSAVPPRTVPFTVRRSTLPRWRQPYLSLGLSQYP